MSFIETTNKILKRACALIVEDDTASRKDIGKALVYAGFEPMLAGTGEQGLRLLRHWRRRIDWLYTKVELPGLVDGWILADEFHQAYPDRPVLYGLPPHAKPKVQGQGLVLGTPVQPATVPEILLGLVHGVDMSASVMRWAA